MHIIWQILALVRVLTHTSMLEIVYLKHKLQHPNTSLCKPIVTSSCQQFLKFEFHNSNLTSSFTWQILALVRVLPLNVMLEVIYLKHKLQTTKLLVSLDAYNLVIATTITEAFSEFIKFEYFQLLVTSILSKLIYFMQSLSYYICKAQSHHSCNEMFRYSLLHRRIIHTTLLVHRAFLAAN